MTLTNKILAGALVLVTLMVGLQLLLRYFTNSAALGGHTTETEPVKIKIADTLFNIPQNIIRSPDNRKDGDYQGLDLYFQWPGLDGYSETNADLFNYVGQGPFLIFASLSKGELIDTPKRRLEGIYQRFFVGKPWRGPNGLIGQALDPSSGYTAENVYYGRLGDEIFVTRCLQRDEAEKNNFLPTCLYEFMLDERIVVNVRYHVDLLEMWQEIDNKLKRHLISMRSQ